MRSAFFATAALASAATLSAQPALAQTTQLTSERPAPSENLPPDFIDSRPILAYFDDQPMPDTVRGLLEELKRPDRCAKNAAINQSDACALVLYRLHSDLTPDRLRPPFILKAIYRVSDPEDPANTVMIMPDSKGILQRYTGENLYEPLRNIRANICLRYENTGKCTATESQGVLYVPYAILGKVENDRENILPSRSANRHFSVAAETVEQVDGMTRDALLAICRANKTCSWGRHRIQTGLSPVASNPAESRQPRRNFPRAVSRT